MRRAAVVGLGLIGGSAALAFSARGFDRAASVRQRARARGIDVAESLEEALRGADLVVLAVPTSETPAALQGTADLAPAALLTDCASLKDPVLAAAARLPPGSRFVAGHPMAGAATRGVDGAAADLFAGRPWLVVRAPATRDEDVEELSRAVESIGARPVIVAAERHDALMTWVSHLPFGVSAALATAVRRELGPDAGACAGPGLLDTTRLAGTPAELALELSSANPKALADSLDAVSLELSRLARELRGGDRGALAELLAEAARARADIASSR